MSDPRTVPVCTCGDTPSCHQNNGTGSCWVCACIEYQPHTPDTPKRPNYGYRYTGD